MKTIKNLVIILCLVFLIVISVIGQTNNGSFTYNYSGGINNAPYSWFKDFYIDVIPNTPIEIHYTNNNSSSMIVYSMENGQYYNYKNANEGSGYIHMISSSEGRIFFRCSYYWDNVGNPTLVIINYSPDPTYTVTTQPTIIQNDEFITGNLGIGTTVPKEKLTVSGGHGDTKIRLYSTGDGGSQPANLSLWASEPGMTYTGTGIGYNVNGSPYYGRIDNSRGSSYIRFLPCETKFQFQNASGSNIEALTIKENGNVGIGTPSPGSKLEIAGSTQADEEVGSIKLKSSSTLNQFMYAGYDDRYSAGYIQCMHPGTAAQNLLLAPQGGNVGIGTTTPGSKLEIGVPHDYNQSEAIRIGSYYDSGFYGMGMNYRLDGNGNPTGNLAVYHNSVQIDAISFDVSNGYVGIGTTIPDQALTVKGKIHANEVIVDLQSPIQPADFVFDSSYKLMPLNQVEQFVKTNNHLPEIPSAAEVSKNGLNMGEMQNKLLQKVEELTLYLIDMQKTINVQSSQIEELKKNQK